MITVTLFTAPSQIKDEKKIRSYLNKAEQKVPHQLVVLDVTTDASLYSAYKNQLPYLKVGPYHLAWPFSQQELQVALQAASNRASQNADDRKSDEAGRIKHEPTYNKTDRFTLWFTGHYMLVFNLLVGFYIGMAFLAPTLMKLGARGPARLIYTVYSPLCHQLAFRSWFIFGEQWFYPRELAGIEGVMTLSQATGISDSDPLAARRFIGDEVIGYKVALCQRDIAIYLGILLFGIVFATTRSRISALPWYVWVLVGIVPLGVDGASQLPSLLSFFPPWFPLRESTPFLRTLTGLLFGVTTAWYGFPLVEESVQDTRRILLQKKAIMQQLGQTRHDTG